MSDTYNYHRILVFPPLLVLTQSWQNFSIRKHHPLSNVNTTQAPLARPRKLWQVALTFPSDSLLSTLPSSIMMKERKHLATQLDECIEALSLSLQGSTNRRAPGFVNFVLTLAYHFCLNLPAAFTQPGAHLLVEPCTSLICRPEREVKYGMGRKEGTEDAQTCSKQYRL